MAYDQGSAYEAPRRVYYGQSQQQAPAAYGNQDPIQDGRGYDRGYGEQQYGGQTGYAGNTPVEAASYSDGYGGGYRQPTRQQANSSPQDQRSYDPRYQQRPVQQPPQQQRQQIPRSHSPRYQQHTPIEVPQYAQHPGERAQQYQQPPMQYQQPRQEHRVQSPPQQPPVQYQHPRQDHRVQSPVQPRQLPIQQNGYTQPAPSRSQANGNASMAPRIAATASHPPKQDPKKMTMEEWKAKERAKMHADAQSPEGLAQDNAFPTFPNFKKERLTPDSRSGGQSAMSHRSSGEQARLSMGSNAPPAESRLREERPAMPRGNSHNRDVPAENGYTRGGQDMNSDYARAMPPQQSGKLAPQPRPSLDHQPYSFEPIVQQSREQPMPPQQYHQSQHDMQSPNGRAPPHSANNAMDHRQHPQSQANVRSPPPIRQSPPTVNGSAQHYADGHPGSQAAAYHAVPQAAQQRPGTAGGGRPPVQPIDTKYAQQERVAYMDHHPLSPAQVPPRPATGHDARSPRGQQVISPSSQYSSSRTPHGYGLDQAALAPQQQQYPPSQTHPNASHDDYGAPHHAVTSLTDAPTRDQEIEAEMPDFDSAAPQQTSMLHKKQATMSPPPPAVATMMPPQQFNQSVQSLPSHPKTRAYQQSDDPYQAMARQKQVPPRKTPPPNRGFDFGLDDQHQPAPQGYQQSRAGPYQQTPGSQQYAPPQPAFAKEPPPRRSMDDARQMPYRPGVQGQGQPNRSHPTGQPGRGPSRPEMGGREGSGQTVQTMWSEPGGQSNGHPNMRPRPPTDRNFSGQTVATVRSEPGHGMTGMNQAPSASRQPMPMVGGWNGQPEQRVPSAPPLRQGLQAPPSGPAVGAPLTQQRSAPEQQQQRYSNPDALPKHPTPVRPGLMEGGLVSQPAKPPPVRNYNGTSQPTIAHQRNASVDPKAKPVTQAELDSLRAAVAANPNNNKQALLLAKKLVEASTVLIPTADPRAAAKARETYILDAHKRIKKLASSGYPEAQFYLADCYGQGSLGLEVDTKEAFNLYQAAAKQGHPQAAYRTAVCCEMGPEEGGGTRKDYAKAVQWYRRAAALGDIAAMFKLGMILLKCLLGQPRNVGESVTWLKRAAERADRDNPHALHELGMLYEPENADPDVRNKIVADETYARQLFLQAAGLGYKFSQFRLGQAYEYGSLGLPIDNRASISYYSKAAAQGEHQAELALSGWYLTGAEGILANSDTEAYLWARKAAQAEPPLAKAMFAMGYFSEMGIGCPASIEEARKWYGRAASYRFPKALERLEELKRNGKGKPAPANGKLMRKDQKRDEAECSVM